jgi:hypothetical protein
MSTPTLAVSCPTQIPPQVHRDKCDFADRREEGCLSMFCFCALSLSPGSCSSLPAPFLLSPPKGQGGTSARNRVFLRGGRGRVLDLTSRGRPCSVCPHPVSGCPGPSHSSDCYCSPLHSDFDFSGHSFCPSKQSP